MKALISFNAHAQKQKNYFRNVLTPQILQDICYQATGQINYSLRIDEDGYNHGRLLIVEYSGEKTYVTLSEKENRGRNSCIQSVPTALNIYYADHYAKKKLAYYFLAPWSLFNVPYLRFVYRMLRTIDVTFLNGVRISDILPFSSAQELIEARNQNKRSNKGNNSTYVLINEDGELQIYAKTYGANKCESTLMTLACASLYKRNIRVFNLCEGNLKRLPEPSLITFKNNFPNVKFVDTNFSLEKNNFVQQLSSPVVKLRSPYYIYALLEKLGPQRCACCGCPISQLVQGAHIWNVSSIQKSENLSNEDKFEAATSADNGLWLCENHHKLFDSNLMLLDKTGKFSFADTMNSDELKFAKSITNYYQLSKDILTKDTIAYIERRNMLIQ